jgi:hypothetical protein
MFRQLILALLLCAFASGAWASGNNEYKVESIGALTDAKVAEAVRATLNEKGLRVTGKEGKVICDIWFRKEVPSRAGSVDGANFGQIVEGAVVGVINFPANSNDFRDQGVKAGFYILRYGLSLQDGAHLGVSPSRDFFLITSPADDQDPKDLPPAEVIKLSRKAVGTGHPAPLALTFPTSNEKALPKVVTDDSERAILEVKLKLKTGELAVGLIVVGKSAE